MLVLCNFMVQDYLIVFLMQPWLSETGDTFSVSSSNLTAHHNSLHQQHREGGKATGTPPNQAQEVRKESSLFFLVFPK